LKIAIRENTLGSGLPRWLSLDLASPHTPEFGTPIAVPCAETESITLKEHAMARLRHALTALAVILIWGVSPSMAGKYKINTAPELNGRVFVDGAFVGVAPVTLKLKFEDDQIHIVHAEKDGCMTWPVKVDEDHDDLILVRLEIDKSWSDTVASEIANRWLTVEARHALNAEGHIDENLVWQKIVSIVSDRFSDIEQMDRGSFYLRTAWRSRTYPYSVVRHRIVVKRDVGPGVTVKLQLESQVFQKDKPGDPVDPDKFVPSGRIFHEDGEVVTFVRDQL
jgi:hypothetical protein